MSQRWTAAGAVIIDAVALAAADIVGTISPGPDRVEWSVSV